MGEVELTEGEPMMVFSLMLIPVSKRVLVRGSACREMSGQ